MTSLRLHPTRESAVCVRLLDVQLAPVLSSVPCSPLKKTLAFTRANDSLDALVTTSAQGSDRVDHPSFKGRNVAVMNFGEVDTQARCEEYLKEFTDPANPCTALLITVNIRSVGARRVNSLRQIVDDCGEVLKHKHVAALNRALADAARSVPKDKSPAEVLKAAMEAVPLLAPKHVVICVLVPPVWIGGVADAYPSLFLNGWAFTYLDAAAESEGSVSAAAWLKVSAGLADGFTTDCIVALRGLNKRMLLDVVLNVNGSRGIRHFQSMAGPNQTAKLEYVALEPFYMDPPTRLATVADRVSALEKLEQAMGGETLCSLMAAKFLGLFPKQVILSQLVAAANACLSGAETRGLTAALNDQLVIMYRRFARELYVKAAAGYNLQSLYAMYSRFGGSVMRILHEFTACALDDLCPLTLDDVSDSRGDGCRKVSHDVAWEWHPLPFLGRIKQEAMQEIVTLRSRNAAGIIDAVGLEGLRASVAKRFPALLANGEILGSHTAPVKSFFRDLLLRSVARLIGGEGVVVYSDAVEVGATEQYAVTYLQHCVKNEADIASILVFSTSTGRRELQRQLLAIAKLEQGGLVSAKDVEAAAAGVTFEPLSGLDEERVLEVAEANSRVLLSALWNLLLVRLWVGLCHTFDAKEELKLVAKAGLSTDAGHAAVAPHQWCAFAVDAVNILTPIRQQLTGEAVSLMHEVIMDSLMVVTPLVSSLFGDADEDVAVSKATDTKRRACVKNLLPLIRAQVESFKKDEHGKLTYLRMVQGAFQLLPGLQAALPAGDASVLVEFLERVLVDSFNRFCKSFGSELSRCRNAVVCEATVNGYTRDLVVALRVFNGRDTNGVVFPEAFRASLLQQLVAIIFQRASASVHECVLTWFKRLVNAELDKAGEGAPMPRTYGDVQFVPDWYVNMKELGAPEDIPTHAALVCPLAKTLFHVLLKTRMPGDTLGGVHLPGEYQYATDLKPVLGLGVNPTTRRDACGWYACVERAVAETTMIEAIVGDMAPPEVPRHAAGGHRGKVAAGKLEVLHVLHDMLKGKGRVKGKAGVRECLAELFAGAGPRLYLVVRLMERYSRDHLSKVLNHPHNVELLGGEWLKPFQEVFPMQAAEEGALHADAVRQSLIGQDFYAQLPFMWPRTLLKLADVPPESKEDAEEAKAWREFYKETVTAFSKAHARLAIGDSAGCSALLDDWTAYFAEYAGNSDDPNAPARLRAKMFLFCVVAWVWFNKDAPDERRCSAVLELMPRIQKALLLDDKEVRLFRAFADPHAIHLEDPDCHDAVTSLFFRPEELTLDEKRLRAAGVATIASVLGLPRGTHVMSTHLFDVPALHRSYGICSYRNHEITEAIHYDCGTVLNPETGLWDYGDSREPLTDPLVLCSLLLSSWALIGVSLSLFGAGIHSEVYGPIFTKFFRVRGDVGEVENLHRKHKPRDAVDWVRTFVWMRCEASWKALNMCVPLLGLAGFVE